MFPLALLCLGQSILHPEVMQPPDLGTEAILRRVQKLEPNDNALTYYVRGSIELDRDPRYTALTQWENRVFYPVRSFRQGGGKGLPPRLSAADAAPPKGVPVNLDMTPNQIGVVKSKLFGHVWHWVREGNSKPMPLSKPHGRTFAEYSFGLADDFPIFAYSKQLAKLGAAMAEGEYSAGQSKLATDRLLDVMTLSDKHGQGALIEYLVGTAIRSIGYAAFDSSRDRIRPADARRIEARALKSLVGEPAIVASLRAESERSVFAAPLLLKDMRDGAAQRSTELDPRLVAELRAMTDADWKAATNRIVESLRSRFDRFHKIASGPESAWTTAPKAADTVVPDAKDIRSIAQMESFCYDLLTQASLYSEILVTEAKSRTQTRLLGLHMAVLQYRAKHGKPPTTLAKAVGEKRALDPINGKPFLYHPRPDGSYWLVSAGIPQTGLIGLRYRKNQDVVKR